MPDPFNTLRKINELQAQLQWLGGDDHERFEIEAQIAILNNKYLAELTEAQQMAGVPLHPVSYF